MRLKLRRYGLGINTASAVGMTHFQEPEGQSGSTAMSEGSGHDTDYFIRPEFLSCIVRW